MINSVHCNTLWISLKSPLMEWVSRSKKIRDILKKKITRSTSVIKQCTRILEACTEQHRKVIIKIRNIYKGMKKMKYLMEDSWKQFHLKIKHFLSHDHVYSFN